MPQYIYRCNGCDIEFEIFHSINDILIKCEKCDEESLMRIPQPVLNTIATRGQKVGTAVKEHIKDAQTDLQRQKQEMKNETYNDD